MIFLTFFSFGLQASSSDSVYVNTPYDSLDHSLDTIDLEPIEWDHREVMGVELSYMPVIFENSADLFVNVSNLIADDYSISLRIYIGESNLIETVVIDSTTSDFVVTDLAKDTSYTLKAFLIDESSPDYQVGVLPGTVSTTRKDKITLTPGLYNAITEFSTGEFAVKLSDYLLGIESQYNIHELAAFVQHHYKIDVLERDFSGGLSSLMPAWFSTSEPRPNEVDPDKPCDCSLISASSHLEVKGERSSSDPIGPDNPHFEGATNLPEVAAYKRESKNRRNHLLMSFGPAKYHGLNVQTTGLFDSSERSETSSTTGYDLEEGYSATSPFFAKQGYNFFCNEYTTQIPANCDCDKTILIDYSYSTRMKAQARVPSGWGGRGARASAEDFALLSVGRLNSNDIEIIDAGRGLVGDACATSWNADWVSDFLTLAVDVTLLVLELDDIEDLPDHADALPDIVDNLTNVLTTDIIETSGDCTYKHETGTLISGSTSVTLKPNDPVEVVMTSYSSVHTSGYGKYRASAMIASNYHLSTILLQGELENKWHCCSPKIGQHSIGYYRQLPTKEHIVDPIEGKLYTVPLSGSSVHSQNNLKAVVNYFISLWPEWSELDKQYGSYVLPRDGMEYVEPTTIDCWLNVPNSSNREIIHTEDEGSLNERVSTILPNPVRDILEIQSESPIVSWTVYSMGGLQVMTKSNINAKQYSLTSLNSLPSGSYIIEIVTEDQTDYHQFIKQ